MSDGRPVIYAYGKSGETTLSATLSAGSRSVELSSATSAWTVGAVAFVGIGGGIECLGAVTSVDGTTIETSQSAQATWAAGMAVWVATLSCVMPWSAAGDPQTDRDDGIESTQTGDGLTRLTQIRDASETLTINYPQVTTTALAALRTFLTESSGPAAGLRDFVVSGWDWETDAAALWTVRLVSGVPSFRATSRGLGSYAVQAQVIGSGWQI